MTTILAIKILLVVFVVCAFLNLAVKIKKSKKMKKRYSDFNRKTQGKEGEQ